MTPSIPSSAMSTPGYSKWLLLITVAVVLAVAVLRMSVDDRVAPSAVVLPQVQSGANPAAAATAAPRPDAISDLEWQVLQGVAAQHADPKAELARLVANLRFNKACEQWRALSSPDHTARRQVLAAQLLAEIPDRVAGQALDADAAKTLQRQLLADLVSDPAQREQRAAREAERLPHLVSPSR